MVGEEINVKDTGILLPRGYFFLGGWGISTPCAPEDFGYNHHQGKWFHSGTESVLKNS